MSSKLAGIIATATLLLVGCNQTANQNANMANDNMRNANANSRAMANQNANANANTNSNANRGPTREEYEANKDRYQREAKQSGRTVGTGLNDGWLWVKARFDLAAANDLRDSTINVDVANAVVTLSGTVATAAQKTKAESVAKSVEGVKSVRNMLKVAANTSSNSNANTNMNKKRP
ncbi:MAG: BON domain-containing protein [Pyrinomonadaceae bacterium]